MAEQQTSVIVGVFESAAEAHKAYDDLRNAGFGHDYLGIAENGESRSNSLLDLEKSGVPGNEAQFYTNEYNQGRTLVTVHASGLPADSVQRAANILRTHGAYDARGGRDRSGDYASNVTNKDSSPYFDLNAGSDRPL